MNPNPEFKVTPLFSAESLRNGKRQSTNLILIGTYKQAYRVMHHSVFVVSQCSLNAWLNKLAIADISAGLTGKR